MISLGGILIPKTINPGSIYYLSMDSFVTSEPHYFVVLNINPRTDELIVLVSATSKIEKRKRRIALIGENPRTLVEVSNIDCPFLKKDQSIFDCNNVEIKDIQFLVSQCERGLCTYKGEISPGILDKLRAGVGLSKQVSPEIKEKI